MSASRCSWTSPGSASVPPGSGRGGGSTLSGRGFVHSGRGRTPRAIVQFDPAANDGVLAGFELTGASNATDNGAGVRINQANRVSIRDCDVHHNDIGIMSNGNGTLGSAAAQLIEHTAIHDNGDDRLPAFNHNLYLGGTSATLRFCEVRGARTGHNLKSRLHVLRVEYSYIHASVNRELDLVDAAETAAPGSDVVLLGNVIVKSRTEPGNRGVIHFGQDGGRAHKGTLYLVHNTIVTPFVSPVVDLSSAGADAVLLGNIIDDGGRLRPNQVLGDGRRGGASATRITGRRNRLAPGFASRLGRPCSAPRTTRSPSSRGRCSSHRNSTTTAPDDPGRASPQPALRACSPICRRRRVPRRARRH